MPDTPQVIARDLYLSTGSRFTVTLPYNDDAGAPVNTTGWGARLIVREGRLGALVLSLTEKPNAAGSSVTPQGVPGGFVVDVLPADTRGWTLREGVYWLLADPDGAPGPRSFLLYEGAVFVDRAGG
jgi:hypothetical protein